MNGPGIRTRGADGLPRRRAGIELQSAGTRTLLLSTQEDTVFELDPLGRALWELCDGNTSVDEMVAAVCEVFDVDEEAAGRDVWTLMIQLEEAGLVDYTGMRG
jgi:hypothetical protein